MTWLSRLLPPSRGLERLAAYHHSKRARRAQRHRRESSLESLERRALLAGNVTVSSVVGGVLTITSDTHNDTFTVTEDGANEVTVTGTTTTTINNTFSPVNRFGVDNINITLNHGLVVNTIFLTLTQTPFTESGIANVDITVTPSTLAAPASNAAEVFLLVYGVTNTGTFTLTDGNSTTAGGTLIAGVYDDTGIYDSAFAQVTIEQFGCCPGYVELYSDSVPGTVIISVGWDNYNEVEMYFDQTGQVYIDEGQGPGAGTGTNQGAEQTVNIEFDYCKSVTVYQFGFGGTDETYLTNLEVALAGPGIVVEQPNSGGFDSIFMESITTTGRPTNRIPAILDSIEASQGNGSNDYIYISNAQVYGNITCTQGNGNYDEIYIFATQAGYYEVSGPIITEIDGTLTCEQGDGYEVSVILNNFGSEGYYCDTFNNVYILQGDSVPPSISCYQITGDLVCIDATYIQSDLYIVQGVFGTSYGENVVAIADNYCDYPSVTGSTHVSVGDSTFIWEYGANSGDNSVYLGGVNPPDTGYTYDPMIGYSPDFETAYLDVYTGTLGGAYVQVFNTIVDVGNGGVFGSFGAYEFEGLGGSNIAVIDYFSYYYGGVDADPADFNILLV